MKRCLAWLAHQWTVLRYRWALWLFMRRLRQAQYKLGKALLPALMEAANLAEELNRDYEQKHFSR